MNALLARIPVSDTFRQDFLSHKKLIYIVIILWFLSIGLGFLVPESIGNELIAGFAEKVAGIENKGVFGTFLFIFLNNIQATMLVIVFGLFLVLPLVVLIFNGVVVGVFLDRAASVTGISLFSLLLSLVPHGILEIPAIILSAILGTCLGYKLYAGKRFVPELSRRQFLKDVFIVYISVIIPMIFVAALLESTLSAYVAQALI